MADNLFQEQAITAFKQEVVDIIRETSIAFKIYPLNQAVEPSDSHFTYYKAKESGQVQYAFELQTPMVNKYATEKVITAIPTHQANIAFSRHEAARARKDVLNLDARIRFLIEDMVDDQNRTAVYGDADTGTILSDTTNISTAAADELDLGTFVEGVQHFHASVSQCRNLLKSKFQGCKLKVVWTSDVDDRARAINNTYNQAESFYDWLGAFLVRFNGGGTAEDHIFVSNYLGSATNAGTTNMAMIASDPRNMELIHSRVEVVQGQSPREDLEIEVAQRLKPVFYRGNDAVIYHATVVLTA